MNISIIVIVILVVIYVIFRLLGGSIKHSAVRNAFLAKYTYQRLTETQKREVYGKTLAILVRSGLIEEDFEFMCEMLKFSFFALAMNELGIEPALKNEEWNYVKNPYTALHNSDHQVEVVKNVFMKNYNVSIDMEKFKDLKQMYKNR